MGRCLSRGPTLVTPPDVSGNARHLKRVLYSIGLLRTSINNYAHRRSKVTAVIIRGHFAVADPI